MTDKDIVIAGLDPAIQAVLNLITTGLDYPVKPGNDDWFFICHCEDDCMDAGGTSPGMGVDRSMQEQLSRMCLERASSYSDAAIFTVEIAALRSQ